MDRQLTAFEKFIIGAPRLAAVQHLYECMYRGEPGNQAWTFMEQVRGPDWACKPEDFGPYLLETIELFSKGEFYAEED